jgi:4-hydroxy-tetrahydrodipicolinate synthase
MKTDKRNFTGTGVAMVTPFLKSGAVDFEALTRLTSHIISGKCDYLVVLGTTGESTTLNRGEKAAVLRHIIGVNRKKLPVVLGIGGNNTASVIAEISEQDFEGVDALLSVSPYYNKPTQEGIYEHYMQIADASPVPVILYNVPGRTSSNITAATTLRLAGHPNIIGIKEASGNFDQCMSIIKKRPAGFLVISGDDNITLPLIAAGLDGVISVVANAWPKEFSEMVRLARANRFDQARKWHYSLFDIIPLLFAEGNPSGIKHALKIKSICNDFVRLPLVPVSRELSQQLKKAMQAVD